MGRTPTFDTTKVVRAARDLFWDQGYDRASLSDLESVTGLSRSSLYHAFGSKRGLFDAAVEDYLTTVVGPRLRILQADPPHTDAATSYVRGLIDRLRNSPQQSAQRGCLLLNNTPGLAAHDEPMRVVVDSYRVELTNAYRQALQAIPTSPLTTQATPDVPRPHALTPDKPSDDTIDRRARLLTSLTTSALMMAHINLTEAVATLEIALDAIASWSDRTISSSTITVPADGNEH